MSCKNDPLKDRHHIIPVHAGGRHIPNNLIKIGRTCHAMFHFCNWHRTGNKKDYVAWKGLAGQISKQEMIKILSSESGRKSFKEKSGIHGLSKEARFLASSSGGKKASNYMRNSTWINNGVINRRILINSEVPEGFIKGKIKKPKKKKKKSNRNMEEYLGQFSGIINERLVDIKSLDLTKRGCIANLSRKWGVSHTQVRRFINKHFARVA